MSKFFSVIAALLLFAGVAWPQAIDQRKAGMYVATEAGATCTQATLELADDAALALGYVLVIPPVDRLGVACQWSIASNLTIDSPIYVPPATTPVLRVETGMVLTLASCPRIGQYQAWEANQAATGEVVITSSGTCPTYPKAWAGNDPADLPFYDFVAGGVSQLTIGSTGVVSANLAQTETLATQTVTADTDTLSCGTTTFGELTLPVTTSGGAINLLSNPQLAAGVDKQICRICGTSDTDFVVLDDGAGLDLLASINLTDKVCLLLEYVALDSVWRQRSVSATTTIGGTDRQVLFKDGIAATGEAGFTYIDGVLSVANGVASACDPTVDVDRCDNQAIYDTQSPDSPASGSCDFKWVSNGTAAALEYICGDGFSLQRTDRERFVAVTTDASVTLTNEQCWAATITNNDADALTVNLCATPQVGSLVCVKDAAGGVITVNPDNADSIIWDGVLETAGDAIVSSGTIGDIACFEAITSGVWFGDRGGTEPWIPE